MLKKDEEDEQPEKNQRIRLTAGDLEKHSQLKYVFVTASPVLTNEVKRFYT